MSISPTQLPGYLDWCDQQYRLPADDPTRQRISQLAAPIVGTVNEMHYLDTPPPAIELEKRADLLCHLERAYPCNELAGIPDTAAYARRVLIGKVMADTYNRAAEQDNFSLMRRMTAFACDVGAKEMAAKLPMSWWVTDVLQRTICAQMPVWNDMLARSDEEGNDDERKCRYIDEQDVGRVHDIFAYCLKQDTLAAERDEIAEFMLRYHMLDPEDFLPAWQHGFSKEWPERRVRQKNLLRIIALDAKRDGVAADLRQRFGLRCLARYPLPQLRRQHNPTFLQGKKRAAVATAIYDHNNALYHPVRYRNLIDAAAEDNWAIAFFELGNLAELNGFHAVVKEAGFSQLVLQLHSSVGGSMTGYAPAGEELWTPQAIMDHKDELFAYYQHAERIIFNGCSVSQMGGPAEALSLATGRETIGLTNPIATKIVYKDGKFMLKNVGTAPPAGLLSIGKHRRGRVKVHEKTSMEFDQYVEVRLAYQLHQKLGAW